MSEYLGLDIGGTSLKLGRVNDLGVVSGRAEFAMASTPEQPLLSNVLDATDGYLRAQGIPAAGLAGIGISATGQIDTRRGIVAGVCGSVPAWLGSDISGEFSRRFARPVAVMNDAKCALLGEQWLGAARGHRQVVLVTLGTGVGGGILVDGHILLGRQGLAGEVGHFPMAGLDQRCACGNMGCFEHYASVSALTRAARAAYPERRLTGRDIFAMVAAGDPRLEGVLAEWLDHVAAGLIGLVHTFNPSLLLIGGGVSEQREVFMAPLRKKVLAGAMPRFREGLRVEAASLGNDAGLIGAVKWLMERMAAGEGGNG